MEKPARNDPPSPSLPAADAALFAVLAHELKSPVNTIESLLRVIADGFTGEANPRTLEFVSGALERTGEARALIVDLLNLEKYSGGRLERREEDVAELVAAAFRRRQEGAVARNIAYALRRPPDTRLLIRGDREGLGLAFANLIDNAVKYAPENGSVTVSVAVREPGTVLVSVADSGPGLAEEDRARLFTPFFRSRSVRGRTPGTGLGLSIVKRVIEAHGGTIEAESTPGAGTTFTVHLPLERSEAARVAERRRIVIVGGVTAGPKAAARLRRLDENLDITIIEKSEFLSYAGCGIPAYLSGAVRSPRALMTTADRTLRDVHFFEHIKGIRILNRTLALRIDRKKKEVIVRDLSGGQESAVPYDTLLLATGARSLVPDIPGIDGRHVHSLYKIEDAERIRGILEKTPAAEVYIIGGGLVGVETAESLMATGARVTVLEQGPHILPVFDPDIADKIAEVLSLKGIKVVTGTVVTALEDRADRCRIVTRAGEMTADLVILSAGVAANADLGREAGLALGPRGGLAVDEHLRTSDPSIYAAGDCAEAAGPSGAASAFLPLGSISTKMGRIAADNIAGRPTAFGGGLGTTMFRIFDTAAARTGLGEEQARRLGLDPVAVAVSGLDHAHFYPGAADVVIKAVADRGSRRLLGAQGYGRGDVVSRVGILAAAVGRGLTLAEVFALDLGYYPSFNNPIDILQTACIVLENKLDGLVRTVTRAEFLARRPGTAVVDLSPIADFSFHAIADAVNLPLESLRDSVFPYDREADIVLCSTTSARAYEAYRYLAAQGYRNLRVLEGGYIHYKKG